MSDDKKYRVKNKFLRAIMGDEKSQRDLEVDYHFYGLRYGKGVGSAVLTYLVRKAFNIHRFPYFEDRHFSSYDGLIYGDDGVTALEKISNCDVFLQNIDDMLEELKEMYRITQEKLEEMFPKQETVELIHNIDGNYAAVLLELKNNALKTSQEYIKIETDTIDCFTNNESTYHKAACYKMNIEKSDILYFDEVIDQRGDVLVEEYEYIVMNKDMLGLRKIPVSCIKKTREDFNELGYITHPILNQTKYCHIRTSENRFVCFDKAEINSLLFKLPSNKKPSLLCELIERFCNNR